MKQSINHLESESFDELRYFARVVGILALLTGILYMRNVLTGSFMASSFESATINPTTLFTLILIATLGLLIAWRWEQIGGFIATVTAIAVGIIIYTTFTEGRLLAAFVFSSPFAIGGILYLVDWWRHKVA